MSPDDAPSFFSRFNAAAYAAVRMISTHVYTLIAYFCQSRYAISVLLRRSSDREIIDQPRLAHLCRRKDAGRAAVKGMQLLKRCRVGKSEIVDLRKSG